MPELVVVARPEWSPYYAPVMNMMSTKTDVPGFLSAPFGSAIPTSQVRHHAGAYRGTFDNTLHMDAANSADLLLPSHIRLYADHAHPPNSLYRYIVRDHSHGVYGVFTT